jgi:dipeptidyl aminopeptidase/acylaminoacyl peptidase
MINKALFSILLMGIAEPPQASADPAEIFGARESIEQASLSPDGTKLAYLVPAKGQGATLHIVPLDGTSASKGVLMTRGDPERIGRCKWAADTRLVCSIYGVTKLDGVDLTYFSRQIALDADGQNLKVLMSRGGGRQLGIDLYGGSVVDWLPDENGSVLITREFIPEYSTGTHLASRDEGVGLVKLDTRTLSSSTVEPPRKDASEFITDGRGNARIMGRTLVSSGGYATGETKYLYRSKASRDWKELSTVDVAGDGFNPYGVDPELDVAYGLKKLDGRLAAYSVKLDGSLQERLIFAHPEVDVDGFIRIGRRGRIIGVSYATHRRQAKYFDPAFDKLAQSLAKAVPNLPLIRFVDSSVDESKLLIWAGSDTNPGRYFLLDRNTKQMSDLMPVRPELEKLSLSPMKPVSYAAADGTQIPAYLTLPPGRSSAQGLPGIVMPHGGPGSRDEWGFDWLAQFFAGRGYAVLQPNFRGSQGYGDAWFQKNGFQNWRLAIGDVADGGRWLVSQGMVDPAKLAIFGWSYGGYAGLQAAATDPALFKAVVAVAPVTDLSMLKEERRGWSDFSVVSKYIGSGAHLDDGSPARQAAKIKAPVLMFHGDLDRNVGIRQSKHMASKLKGAGAEVELVTYDKLDHYLDDSSARADMLRRSNEFLRRTLRP